MGSKGTTEAPWPGWSSLPSHSWDSVPIVPFQWRPKDWPVRVLGFLPSHDPWYQQLLSPALSSLGKPFHEFSTSHLNGWKLRPALTLAPVWPFPSVLSAGPLTGTDFKMSYPHVIPMIASSYQVFPWSHWPPHLNLSHHLCMMPSIAAPHQDTPCC